MYKKLKSYLGNDAIFMASLLLCVGVISFGLGRLSVADNLKGEGTVSQVALLSGANIEAVASSSSSSSAITTKPVPLMTPTTSPYVGSKSGTKYHLVTCPGAKQIKLENKIYFKTVQEAEASGYSKAANCPGL